MIIRGPRPERYTILRREMLNDERLSYRALGLLTYILDKPDDWRVESTALANPKGREGREAVRTALRELERAGYLRRSRIQAADGTWSMQSVVSEVPTGDGFPGAGSPGAGFPGAITSTEPKTENELDAHFVRVASAAAAARDALYAEVIRVCGMSYERMTPPERKRTGVAVSNLLKVGAKPEEVEPAADIYLQRHSSSLTPSALASQWSRLHDDAPVAKAPVPKQAQADATLERAMDRLREKQGGDNVVPMKRSGS